MTNNNMIKPDCFFLDFCIAKKILHAKEARQLQMRVNSPAEKIEMANRRFSSLEVDWPFAGDQHEYPPFAVRVDQGSPQISSQFDALTKMYQFSLGHVLKVKNYSLQWAEAYSSQEVVAKQSKYFAAVHPFEESEKQYKALLRCIL